MTVSSKRGRPRRGLIAVPGAPRRLAARLLEFTARHRAVVERIAARGTITILFTDIAGFTSITETLGERAAVALLDVHDRVVAAEVKRRGGRVVKSLGDGIMAAFPEASGAVAAAAGILETTREVQVRGAPLRLRIGLDTGRASRRGDDYVGHAVNVASRLTRRARPGQALASDAVRRAARGSDLDVEWKDLGRVSLKGIAQPPRTWRVRPRRARGKS
ncbi:MAG: adenylate/guanylate cyclase domain-containing protein [Acidobacteria bacterium]|nr:adenylate/guanylate cyclase domain-containing protein [Acidobacteriota bacterium]